MSNPDKPFVLQHEAALAEQHLGEWQGLNRAAFFASRPIEVGSYWFAPIDDPAPGGESFMDLYNRVRGAIERINAEHAGRDVIGARQSAGARPRLYHRQLLGDAARSSRKRRPQRLAGADGQPAAADRRRLAQRPASAGWTGDTNPHQTGLQHRLLCHLPHAAYRNWNENPLLRRPVH